MAHFAVVAPAFYSQFNALEALSIALIERGHRVTFIQRAEAASWLSDERVGFRAVELASTGTLQNDVRRAADAGLFGIRRLIKDMARQTDALCRMLPQTFASLRIDVVIADQMEAAGGLVAQALGIPLISVACALPVNRDAGVPLPVMPFSFDESEAGFKRVEISTRIYDWCMAPLGKVIAAHARAFDLTPRSRLDECLSPLLQISQTVHGFDFPRRALPAHFHHVGPLRTPSHTASESAIEGLPPADGRALVFASLGTLQGHRLGLFKRIAKACREIDVQLLIAHCGGLDDVQVRSLQRLGAYVTNFVAQRAVLARADVVVSHAGLNTVMDAIAARTPILAIPLAFDQPGVAARVVHAGIGLRSSATFSSVTELSAQLRRLLDASDAGDFHQHMETLATEIVSAGGAERGADLIENALRLEAPYVQLTDEVRRYA
jgi:zeaxanthin glucosyltransferase